MREIRIYQPGPYKIGDVIDLSDQAAQHVGLVLRMRAGEALILFSGDNREFEARIRELHKKRVSVEILSMREKNRESPCAIHLAQAVSKGDRMETVVQKAVELGVSSISPLVTERCVVRLDEQRAEKKRAQWQAIAIAACEQSGRNVVPQVYPILALQDYVQQENAYQNLVLSPNTNKGWRDYNFGSFALNLLVGPEGGLSSQELSLLQEKNYAPLALGPRVLRTETAALAALSVLQAICGDL